MARRDPVGIRLLTRNCYDWSPRHPAVVAAVNALKVRSYLIGEAVACDERGLAMFDRLRYRRADASVFLYAFDLLELDGQDLRREPLETRKATLASLLRGGRPGARLNEHLEHEDAAVVFRHACALGCEGIVSKRLGSPYHSSKCQDWLKFKNPAAPAVKREAEEEWGR
jgi:bifunctional non-homologous end joining protein LigD